MMHRYICKMISVIAAIILLGVSAAGCTASRAVNGVAAGTVYSETTDTTAGGTTAGRSTAGTAGGVTTADAAFALDTAGLFSDRDLKQAPDLTDATTLNLVSGQAVTLDTEGIYVLSGEATDVTIVVAAAEDAKIQLVLDGVSITNADAPAIYVKTADKVFVTTTDSVNDLHVSGVCAADGDTNPDAVIFSRSDLTLNGSGILNIVSGAGNGVASKDELKITGGTYSIQSSADALEANDAILIYDGTLTIASGKDALHSENAEDESLGYIYMQNGTLTINAADDAIRGNSFVQIDGGTIEITACLEGIEATRVIINDGLITLNAKDDGINATRKVNADVEIIINGGTINIKMGSGDTDAFDTNGDITVNGGTITVTAGSAFDADGSAVLVAGEVTVNGVKITQITVTQGGGFGGRPRR